MLRRSGEKSFVGRHIKCCPDCLPHWLAGSKKSNKGIGCKTNSERPTVRRKYLAHFPQDKLLEKGTLDLIIMYFLTIQSNNNKGSKKDRKIQVLLISLELTGKVEMK